MMKISAYNHLATSFVAGKYLAFNALSGAFLSLDDDRLEDYQALLASIEQTGRPPGPLKPFQQALIANGFAVEDAYDEQAEIRNRYHLRKAESRGLGLTIAPTISCNFGCGYCFQKHSNNRMANPEIEDLVAFVDARLEAGTSLGITWFGGEPLSAFEVIEKLAPRLHALAAGRNCTFTHSIITNGYLLTERRAAFLASIPGFEHAQITLDGSKQHHDQRRPTLAGKGTFDRIVDHLAGAVQHIPLVVRVNVDRRNVGSLELLLDTLASRALQKKVTVYLGHVWAYTDEVGSSDFLTKAEFAAVDAQFKFMKFRKGFSTGAGLPQPRSGAICTADSPNGFVLGPSGGIFNCWNEAHQDAETAPGRYSPAAAIRQSDTKRQWADYDPFSHAVCKSCSVAPLCMAGCPWEAAKLDPSDTGHCVPARFNLADDLRLYDLEQSIAHAASVTPATAPAVSQARAIGA